MLLTNSDLLGVLTWRIALKEIMILTFDSIENFQDQVSLSVIVRSWGDRDSIYAVYSDLYTSLKIHVSYL